MFLTFLLVFVVFKYVSIAFIKYILIVVILVLNEMKMKNVVFETSWNDIIVIYLIVVYI